MKFLYLGLAILILCLALCITSVTVLDRCIDEVLLQLDAARAAAAAHDYDRASQLVAGAMAKWDSHRGFFGVILSHEETDEVGASFHRLRHYADHEVADEFAPTCAELSARVRHIAEMEKPQFANIF